MTKSNYESPAYNIQRIHIDDLVSQRVNPNSMTAKSFEALQTSIRNVGYTFPVLSALNTEYDPATEGLPKPNLLEVSDGEESFTTAGKIGTQVSDDEIAKYFRYRLVDGSHRCQIVRQGKWFFDHGHDHSEDWSKGENIPERPGPDMLAYLAWRENFTVPAVVLDVDATTAMSAEILHNPIWEGQQLTITRTVQTPSGPQRVGEQVQWKEVQVGDMLDVNMDIVKLTVVPEGQKGAAEQDLWLMKDYEVKTVVNGVPYEMSVVDLYDLFQAGKMLHVTENGIRFRVKKADIVIGYMHGELKGLYSAHIPVLKSMDGHLNVQVDGKVLRRNDLKSVANLLMNHDDVTYVYEGKTVYLRSVSAPVAMTPVTYVDEWLNGPMVLLITEKGSQALHKDHLLALEVPNVPVDDLGNPWHVAMDMSVKARETCKEPDTMWFTAEALLYLVQHGEQVALHGGMTAVQSVEWVVDVHNDLYGGSYFDTVDGQEEGFDVHSLKTFRCRCVRTGVGMYNIGPVMHHNTAKGQHSLESMRDIVYNLINVAGMSVEWISQNLYLDVSAIHRMSQLSGLKAAFADKSTLDDCDMAWSPEKDDSFGRKLQAYLTREAGKYVELYRKEHQDDHAALAALPTSGSALDIALELGFDQEAVSLRFSERAMHVTD